MSVLDAVTRDLARIGELDPGLADSALASTALVLAEQLDKPGVSATAKSMCAKALRETLAELRDLSRLEGEQEDALDELQQRRRQRLSA